MEYVARDFFERRDENSCYVTGDGNVYRPRHKELAHQHAREAGVSVELYTREEMKPKKTQSKSASSSRSTKSGSTKVAKKDS